MCSLTYVWDFQDAIPNFNHVIYLWNIELNTTSKNGKI